MSFIGLLAKAIAQGTNYKTADLLTDLDTNFGQAKNSTTDDHTFNFTNANLVSGVLTVNLPFTTNYPKPLIRRPDGTYENAIDIMTRVTSSQVTFDFGGAIQAGTWEGQITK